MHIGILDRTVTNSDEVKRSYIFTVGLTIDESYERFWDAYEDESDDTVDEGIFSFFEFLLISTTGDHRVKSKNRHRDKAKGREHLEYLYKWRKDISPEFSPESRPDDFRNVSEDKRRPYRVGHLHQQDPEGYPEDILPPYLHLLFARIGKEELHHSDEEKYQRDKDKEILHIVGYHDDEVSDPLATTISRSDKGSQEGTDKLFEGIISLPAVVDDSSTNIEGGVIERPDRGRKNRKK